MSDTFRVSNLYSGTVGIGTNSALTTVHVVAGFGGSAVQPVLGATTNSSLLLMNSSSAYGLNVVGSNTGAIHLQSQYFNGGTSPLAITLNPMGGNVGIGTSSPGAVLHVVSSSTTWSNVFQGYSPNVTTQGCLIVIGKASTNYNNLSIQYNHISDGSSSNFGCLQMGGVGNILNWAGNGYVGIGVTNPSNPLHIYGSASQLLQLQNSGDYARMVLNGASGTGGDLIFQAAGSSKYGIACISSKLQFLLNDSTSSVTMTLDSSGNVGIGTNNPTGTLYITSSADFTNSFVINTNWPSIRLGQSSPTGRDWCILNGGSGAGIGEGNFGIFDFTASVYRLCINSSGYVGFGTTNPGYLLDVNGSSRFIGQINIAGAYVIDFGYDQTKENNAGKIGYQTFTSGALDIVGGGTAAPRTVKIWDNLIVVSSLSKGSGTFDIEHPLYQNTNKRLVHSFIEGPRCDLIYRGKACLINGVATVDINKECTQRPECAMDDGTFEALCANPQIFLQNNQTFDRVIGSISGATLSITCENSASSVVIEWMVIAERADPFIKSWERTDSNGYLITQYTAANTSVQPPV